MRAREPFPGRAVLGAFALVPVLSLSSPVFAQTDCSQVSPDLTTTVEVRILSPEANGLLLRGPYSPCNIRVAGLASAVGLPARFDVYLVLDTSGSTQECSGSDVDGDTVTGVFDPLRQSCTDRGDTVLAAEVAGARAFVDSLDLGENRIGVIGFSDPNLFGVTRTYLSLSDDRAAIADALERLFRGGSRGATDYAVAQDLMRLEFETFGEPGKEWVGLFLSDGWPTFPQPPYDLSQKEDWDAASAAADRLAAEGIRLYTFAVGTDAGEPVLRDMAQRTGGRFAAVTDPGELVDALPATLLVGLAAVVVRNVTTGETEIAEVRPTGEFEMTMPGARGWNEIEVLAYASDMYGTRVTCPVRVYLSCAAVCEAHTQGFWHRQCKATGEIGNGGSEPPLLVEEFPDMEVAVGTELAFSGQTTCQALDADPASDMCEKALKQYAALLLNMAWGILGPDCETDLSALGPGLPATAGEAAALIEEWIREGTFDSCVRANDAADAINTGAAVPPAVSIRVLPYRAPLSRDGEVAPEGTDARGRPDRIRR